ncbi:hypothetical protein HanIR_Chr15g0748411 [Helianthus annuus]|nr:hypothetical protein HanIR_Chr15g0748411 [Helianthus annuus]
MVSKVFKNQPGSDTMLSSVEDKHSNWDLNCIENCIVFIKKIRATRMVVII